MRVTCDVVVDWRYVLLQKEMPKSTPQGLNHLPWGVTTHCYKKWNMCELMHMRPPILHEKTQKESCVSTWHSKCWSCKEQTGSELCCIDRSHQKATASCMKLNKIHLVKKTVHLRKLPSQFDLYKARRTLPAPYGTRNMSSRAQCFVPPLLKKCKWSVLGLCRPEIASKVEDAGKNRCDIR